MRLPENFKLRETMHGHGAKGMAFYGYADIDGLGVQMEARRESSRHAFVEAWFHDALPERRFPTFVALRDALADVTDEEAAAEAAKYPFFRSIKPDSCGNRCRLCPREPVALGGERIKHDTVRVAVAMRWRPVTDHTASLCKTHMAEFDGKPTELLKALKAEVAQRVARAEAYASSIVKGSQ